MQAHPGAPVQRAEQDWREVKSGWNAILSSLKSWLETGEGLSLTS